MADTTKGTHEQGTTAGNPGTTANRTSTTAGQSGYSAGSTGTTGGTTGSQTSGQTGSHTGGQSGQGMTGSATQRAQSSGTSQGGGQQGSAQQMMDQVQQTVSDAYDRTTKTLNQTYRQAMDYGRENPGTMTLIAFGAGVAVGLLIAGGVSGSRSRTQRILPPVMNALSEIASEFLR